MCDKRPHGCVTKNDRKHPQNIALFFVTRLSRASSPTLSRTVSRTPFGPPEATRLCRTTMPSHTAPIFVTRLSRGLSHILSRTPTSGYTPTSAFPDIRAHTGIGVHPDIGVYPDIGGHPNIGVNPDFEVHLCGLCRPMLTVCSTAPGYRRSCDTAAILRHRGAPRYSPPGGPCTRNRFVPN